MGIRDLLQVPGVRPQGCRPQPRAGRARCFIPSGQPTNKIIDKRRRAEFITPIPKPKKRRAAEQRELVFDEGKGLSTEEQQYDPTGPINDLRRIVDRWREIPNPADWHVTPETARLLEHWRHHAFSDIRPFFCQVEAAEAMIWLTEVAPKIGKEGRTLTPS